MIKKLFIKNISGFGDVAPPPPQAGKGWQSRTACPPLAEGLARGRRALCEHRPAMGGEGGAILRNNGDKRSFRSVAEKIWENHEPSDFPFIPCYLSRRLKGGERSVARSGTKW